MKTPLYQQHLNAGAKMVEFAGWQMPLNYSSQIAEHNFVRQDAGVFDVSHMTIVDIEGKEAGDFLRLLLANDVAKLENGKALYSCMLNENGGIIDDLIAYRLDENHYRLVCNAATQQKDLQWLKSHQKKFQMTLQWRSDLAMLAVQGPHAIHKTLKALDVKQQAVSKDLKKFHFGVSGEWWIARTGYTGEDGFEIMLPVAEIENFWQALLKADVKPCGLGARDTLRLEAALNLYGLDMDETTTPLESNLAWTIAWAPENRKFIGREALELQKREGIKRCLSGFILQDRGVLRSHQRVIAENVGEGEITSGSFSPTLGYSIALARIPAESAERYFAIIRDKQYEVHKTKLPFVRKT